MKLFWGLDMWFPVLGFADLVLRIICVGFDFVCFQGTSDKNLS